MKILLVEDDENKRKQIISFFDDAFPKSSITVARSYQSGLKAITGDRYDLALLDMTMPTFDIDMNESGGRPQAYAGREILRQMQRRGIKTPILVVTQFDRFGENRDSITLSELDKQLRTDHSENYIGSVYYDVTFSKWREELYRYIQGLDSTAE
jgi:CheY-like chemotaxis protein